MPIDIKKANGVVCRHIAERFQINNLLAANEEVGKMQCEAYFITSLHLEGEKLAESWDAQPLIFDCVGDPELEEAMKLIQLRIGQKRYAQLTTPTPETVNQVAAPD